MTPGSAPDVTQLLANWSRGDHDALERLMPLVYGELRRLASSYLRRERSNHTLQSTALVHEAFMRMVHQQTCSGAIGSALLRYHNADDPSHPVDYALAACRKRSGASSVARRSHGSSTKGVDVDLLGLNDALDAGRTRRRQANRRERASPVSPLKQPRSASFPASIKRIADGSPGSS